MRHQNTSYCAWFTDSMDLSHDAQKIVQVLQNAYCHQTVECIICEGPRKLIKVANHIRSCFWVDVNRDGTRQRRRAGAEMQDFPVMCCCDNGWPIVSPVR